MPPPPPTAPTRKGRAHDLAPHPTLISLSFQSPVTIVGSHRSRRSCLRLGVSVQYFSRWAAWCSALVATVTFGSRMVSQARQR